MNKQSLKRKISELEKTAGVSRKYYVLTIKMWKKDFFWLMMEDNGSPKGKYLKTLSREEAMEFTKKNRGDLNAITNPESR